MKIVGIGVDCEEISRFKYLSNQFINKVFTKKEKDYCNSQVKPFQHYAARFVAKESVIKAFNPKGLNLSFKDIEIIKKGKSPKIKLEKRVLQNKFEVYISIAHSQKTVIAFAIVGEKNG